MGLIPEIDRIDEDRRMGRMMLYRKGPPELYEEFAYEYAMFINKFNKQY